jgi:hypothetical protein
MQFRLETFKNENNKMKKDKIFHPQHLFYTKTLSNTNIGIEFYKPFL